VAIAELAAPVAAHYPTASMLAGDGAILTRYMYAWHPEGQRCPAPRAPGGEMMEAALLLWRASRVTPAAALAGSPVPGGQP
jgi:hypothetical protein